MKNPFSAIRDITRPYRRRRKPKRVAVAPSVSPQSVTFPSDPPDFGNCPVDPVVSVIIPTYGQVEHTLRCLSALTQWRPKVPFEVIVVDDASRDPSLNQIQTIPGIRFFQNPINLGFVRSCNRIRNEARGDLLFFLNNDTVVYEDALDRLVELYRRRKDAGIVGCKLVYPDGLLQEAGGIVWRDASAWNYGRLDNPEKPEYNYVREVDYVSGAAFLISGELWDHLGGFDDEFAPAYYEDTDLAFRVRQAGKKVLYHPAAVVCHLEGTSHGRDEVAGIKAFQSRNMHRMSQRWSPVLDGEHYPNAQCVFRARERARSKKLILVIDHYVPEPDRDAGSRNMMNFMAALLEDGYCIKFFPENLFRTPRYTEELQTLGVEVLYAPFVNSLSDYLQAFGQEFDYVLTSRPHVSEPIIPLLRQHTSAKIIYYGHDLHFMRLRLQAEVTKKRDLFGKAGKMEGLERNIWRQVDLTIYPSQDEIALVRALEPSISAQAVLPFAFSDFAGASKSVKRNLIVFVAGFAHPPNVDAALWLANEIMPKAWDRDPALELMLVGSNPTPEVLSLQASRIRVTGWVSADTLRELYGASSVAIVPLRFGAGIKLKVLEALAEGVPLITTPVGLQGLPGLEDVVSVGSEAHDIAELIVYLANVEEQKRQEIVDRQTNFAMRHYSRDAVRLSLTSAISTLERVPN